MTPHSHCLSLMMSDTNDKSFRSLVPLDSRRVRFPVNSMGLAEPSAGGGASPRPSGHAFSEYFDLRPSFRQSWH